MKINWTDPRIAIYLAAVLIALALIAPLPIGQGGSLESRLKYGLDIEGGSWLQLKLEGAVVELNIDPIKVLEKQFETTSVDKQGDSQYVLAVKGNVTSAMAEKLGYPGAKSVERGGLSKVTITSSPEGVVTNYLKSALQSDVKLAGMAPPQYEIRTNVTRESLNAALAPVGGSVASGQAGFVEGLTPDTVDETKKVLDSKLNRLGLQDIKVRVVGNQFILIDMAGVDVATAQDVVGKPGKFEIRIQTTDNSTEHVTYGDTVVGVDVPRGDQHGMWGVPFTLSDEGAKALQTAAIQYGATKDPKDHELSMYLDKDQIFSAPLALELASSMQKAPMSNLVAEVGTGDPGSLKAKELYIHLREGALPVNVEVIGSGQVTAALGAQFMKQIMIGFIAALLVVAGLIYRRYREKRIVLPMVATSFSEVIMMLGIWALLGWQLDLASIAGIILVIGTGVDHLVIITDELIRGGETGAAASADVANGQRSKTTVVQTAGSGKGLSIRERAAAVAEKASSAKVTTAGPSGKVYITRLSRAFSIILGAAATTAIAMVPLLVMGFGSLTGFALIIIIGVFLGVGIARPAYGRIIGYILAES
jgi:preprotein translocase subunit SecD